MRDRRPGGLGVAPSSGPAPGAGRTLLAREAPLHRHPIAVVVVLAALCACQGAAPPPRGPTTTGGSARGDLGPPQGEPIPAVLTHAPQVPPPTGRDHPATVVVDSR